MRFCENAGILVFIDEVELPVLLFCDVARCRRRCNARGLLGAGRICMSSAVFATVYGDYVADRRLCNRYHRSRLTKVLDNRNQSTRKDSFACAPTLSIFSRMVPA